jgi:hypothetical protein
MSCPHCSSQCGLRTSRVQSDISRELYYACRNVECGHTFKAQLAIICTLSPSSDPRPGINLPIAAVRLRRRPGAANDDKPVPANDENSPLAAPPSTMSG